MTGNKVICWDFDETLGYFREGNKSLTPRIKRTLESLNNSSYLHFIASSAGRGYINNKLKGTDIENLFEGIFDYESVKPDWGPSDGKFYSDVAKAAKLGEDEIPHRMIVIGNSPYDRPINLDGLVFIHHELCCFSNSIRVERLLKKLEEADKESFNKGFDILKKQKDLRIPGISKLQLFYNGNKYNECITPTISLT